MERVSGYKIIATRVANGNAFYDIAIFGKNSFVYENYFQVCEIFMENVSFEKKEEIAMKYGEELPHNFIKELVHIF